MKVKFYRATPDARWSLPVALAHNAAALTALCYQWLPVFIHTICKRKKKYRYQAAICMIFKNEASVLKEWIEYHRLIGVEHFYLYNNNSDDNFREVLAPYLSSGLVTLTDWPYQYAQVRAYEDCYSRFASESHWIAFIDADEFINLQRHNSVSEMLRCYRLQPSLQMQWRDFGTSGHIQLDDNALLTEQFVAAWPWLCNVGKTIINNDFHFKKVSVHYSVARFLGISLYPVNDLHLPSPYFPTLWSRGIGHTVYLNHYFSRSYQWYLYKDQQRGSALTQKNAETRRNPYRFRLHELNNFTHDYSIQRWLTLLKLRMNDNE